MDALGSKTRWKKAPDQINDELLKTLSILIVDDYPRVLEAIIPSLIANMADARFILYRDQSSGGIVAEIMKLKPDVLLMDYQLGNMNGAYLTEQLRKRKYAGCIIGFSSARENIPKFTAAGTNGCIEKQTFDIEKDVLPEIARIVTVFRQAE